MEIWLDKFDYVIQGKIKPNSNFITRKAPGVNHNKGGGIEVVTKKNSVIIENFYMIEKR